MAALRSTTNNKCNGRNNGRGICACEAQVVVVLLQYIGVSLPYAVLDLLYTVEYGQVSPTQAHLHFPPSQCCSPLYSTYILGQVVPMASPIQQI
jgi:hypothetical protein